MVHGQSPFGIPPRASTIDAPAPSGEDAGEEDIVTPAPTLPPIEYVAPVRRRRSPRRRTWTVVIAGILGLIVVTSCVTGGWYLALDTAPEASPSAPPPAKPDPAEALESRASDDAPLSNAEIFGAADKLPEPAGDYRLFHTQELDECDAAATAAMGELLRAAECQQIVRGAVGDPSGDYVVTVGAVNLVDAQAVDRVRKRIDDDHDGAFKALRPNGGSVVGASPTVLGYNALGHYLLYAVVARSDGSAVSSKDDTAPRIVADLVDDYLVTRLEARVG